MLSYLAYFEDWFGPLRLFESITFRAMMAGFTSLFLGFSLAPRFFKWLIRSQSKQILRSEDEVHRLAQLHAHKGTTLTMGGGLIFISLSLSALLWNRPNPYVITSMSVYALLSGLGFVDDFLKLKQKQTRGVPGWAKLIVQALTVFVVMGILLGSPGTASLMSQLWVPFYKFPLIESMPIGFMFGFLFLVISGSSNAINLTDGVDGLAIGCTVTVAIVYGILSYLSGNALFSHYLLISNIPGVGELAILCSALVGAGLAFLWFNAHPATIFMGDTGSLGLGGLIGVIAFMTHQPFTLIIVGGIFVMETLSVILQVASFKLFKRRIFRMAPLHHHFELKGWAESKVVVRFWILSLIFALLGLSTLKLR